MSTRRSFMRAAGATGGALAAAVASTACGVSTGYGTGGAGIGSGPVGNPSKPTTVTIWHAWDGPRQPLMDTIMQRLSEQYPNLKVEQTIVAMWQASNVEKLGAAIAAGTAPDATMLYNDYIPQYGPDSRALQPLDEWIKRDKLNLKQIFYDADVEGMQLDGKTWMLPHTAPIQPVNVAFNKELTQRAGFDFDKNPPLTWDELLQASVKLTQRDGAGIAQLGSDLGPGTGLFEAYMGTVKAAAFSPDGKKVTFNEPRAIEAMEWLVKARQAMGGRAAIQALRDANPGKDLFVDVRKQAIVHHNYSIYFSWPQTAPDLRFGAFAIPPQQKGAEMALPNKSTWGWGMLSSSKEKDAAWLVVKKLTVDEDGGGYLQVQQGRPSPIRKVNESGEFKAKNPYWPVVVKTMEQRWKRPASYIPPDATKAFTDVVARIASEEVAPRAGLVEGASQVQAILDQYWAAHQVYRTVTLPG